MGNEVYANGREVSCKAGQGKTICAFPDVCFTPPQTPATPPGVPIPYPNTGMTSDTTDGSKTVQVSGKEAMLKNKSYFSKSSGDEAGSAPKKGVVTSVNTGKVYFTSWSMDVKFEGENVVRHLDMTTHNHASMGPNTPPWPFMDAMAASEDPCKKEKKKVQKHCSPEKDWKKHCPPNPPIAPHQLTGGKAPAKSSPDRPAYEQLLNQYEQDMNAFRARVNENPCLRARRCMLVPWKPQSGCCPGQTGHHVVDASSFYPPGERDKSPKASRKPLSGWKGYDDAGSPCVCCEGTNDEAASHGEVHLRTGVQCQSLAAQGKWNRKAATTAGAKSVRKTFPGSGCSQKCLEGQLDDYHDDAKDNPAGADPPIRPVAQDNMHADPTWQAFARSDMQ